MSPLDWSRLILAAREDQKLTQSQAAKKWKIPLNTLQTWEQGIRAPGAKHMEKLLPILLPTSTRRRSKKGRSRK